MTDQSLKQLLLEPGFSEGKLLVANLGEFWTITGWSDDTSMRRYRGAGAHLKAMGKLAHWCDEASVAHWSQSGQELPDWETARKRMVENGRRSKVSHPSPRHVAEPWTVPAPRWRIERSLKPRPGQH